MLYSQILNVLPRGIVSRLWASQPSRLSLSHFAAQQNILPEIEKQHSLSSSQQPAATLPDFLCSELPVRCTHILRLLSTLPRESLQSPIIKNVALNNLRDICTLLQPSLQATSPKAFSQTISQIQTSQAESLIRLKYALLSNPTSTSTISLMDNISTVSFGIYNLIDQHLSWNLKNNNHAQKICPEEIAYKAIRDATESFAASFDTNRKIPGFEIRSDKTMSRNFTYVPSVLYNILYESSLLALKEQVIFGENCHNWSNQNWKQHVLKPEILDHSLSLHIVDTPNSVEFKLNSVTPISEQDHLPVISDNYAVSPRHDSDFSIPGGTIMDFKNWSPQSIQKTAFSGWHSVRALACHWGGKLDAVSINGQGSSIYLALDKNDTLLERYASPGALSASAQTLLLHNRRTSAVTANHELTNEAAATQLNAFLYAISDTQRSTCTIPTHLDHHHMVSLSAAIGHL